MKTPLLSHQKNLFVARDGKVIGEYPVMQILSLLETGHVLPTDYCYDVALSEWILVSQFVEKTKFFKPRQEADLPLPPDEKPPLTLEGELRKKKFAMALPGWIAFMLAVVCLAAALAWVWILGLKLDAQAKEMDSLREQARSSKEQYDRLSFSYRALADPGIISGSIINRNSDGVRNAMPGMKVQLFPRDVIEAFLKKKYKDLPRGADNTTNADEMTKYYLASMPEPLNTTITDSGGRFQFKAPKPGQYVVYTSVTSIDQGSSRVWFLAIDSTDPLNTPVDLTDSNYVRDFIPDLMIVDGR